MEHSLSALLKKYNLHPRKGLGQNFLSDPFHLNKIIEAAELTLDDTVLEIGPGPGTLTHLLAESAGQVIAVELDPNMVALLQNEFGHLPNLTIIEADILKTDISSLLQNSSQKSVASNQKSEVRSQKSEILNSQFCAKPPCGAILNYKVVANLPYYITSAVLRHVLETTPQPQRVVVTVQKEVAQRIVARPGQMSLLAVSVQFYGRPTLAHRIPAGAFYPPPKVDSAVVRIDTYQERPINIDDVDFFFQVVKAGFGQKRKQLKNSLAAGLRSPVKAITAAMQQATIDPTRRAETLSLEEWGRLVEVMATML